MAHFTGKNEKRLENPAESLTFIATNGMTKIMMLTKNFQGSWSRKTFTSRMGKIRKNFVFSYFFIPFFLALVKMIFFIFRIQYIFNNI